MDRAARLDAQRAVLAVEEAALAAKQEAIAAQRLALDLEYRELLDEITEQLAQAQLGNADVPAAIEPDDEPVADEEAAADDEPVGDEDEPFAPIVPNITHAARAVFEKLNRPAAWERLQERQQLPEIRQPLPPDLEQYGSPAKARARLVEIELRVMFREAFPYPPKSLALKRACDVYMREYIRDNPDADVGQAHLYDRGLLLREHVAAPVAAPPQGE